MSKSPDEQNERSDLVLCSLQPTMQKECSSMANGECLTLKTAAARIPTSSFADNRDGSIPHGDELS